MIIVLAAIVVLIILAAAIANRGGLLTLAAVPFTIGAFTVMIIAVPIVGVWWIFLRRKK